MKLTKNRSLILSYLKDTPGAHSASAIHSALPDLDLVTIYRTLELFSTEGVIKKMHLKNNEACFEYQKTPHHHAVCDTCTKVVHFDADDTDIIKLLKLKDFSISQLDVIVRGHCTKH